MIVKALLLIGVSVVLVIILVVSVGIAIILVQFWRRRFGGGIPANGIRTRRTRMSDPIFVGIWDSVREEMAWKTTFGVEAMLEDFEIAEADLKGFDVLLAYYDIESYVGNAFVLLRRQSDGILFEVNGGHCSCYGLEEQWEPEETSLEALIFRMTEGDLGRPRYSLDFAAELSAVLAELEE